MIRTWNYFNSYLGDKKIIQKLSNALFLLMDSPPAEAGKGVKRPCIAFMNQSGRLWGLNVGGSGRSEDLEPNLWFPAPRGSIQASVHVNKVWMGRKAPLGGSVSQLCISRGLARQAKDLTQIADTENKCLYTVLLCDLRRHSGLALWLNPSVRVLWKRSNRRTRVCFWEKDSTRPKLKQNSLEWQMTLNWGGEGVELEESSQIRAKVKVLEIMGKKI